MPTDEIVLRRPELEATLAAKGRLAIISGPSGSGKSFLTQQISDDPRTGWSGMVEFRRTDPASFPLHGALGKALRNGLDRPEDVSRLGARLKAAVDALAVGVPRQLAAIGVGRVLAMLTGGLAPDVKASVETLREELQASGPEALASAIETSGGASPLDGFLELAKEVSAFAGENPVTVCLDRGELMGEASLDLLLDLAESELGPLRIIVAINSDVPGGKSALERFVAARQIADPVVLEPLTPQRVAEAIPQTTIATAEGLLAHGNQPIELVDALKDEDALDKAAPRMSWPETIVERVRRSSPQTQAAVLEFAVFSERPDLRTLAVLAGGQTALWEKEQVVQELGLFAASDGAPWFHERRRAAILSGFADELKGHAARGLECLAEQIAEADYLLPAALELALLAKEELTGEPGAAMNLGPDALGVYGAFLELTAPGETHLAVSSVVGYAKTQWQVQDATAGIALLSDEGLVAQSDDDPGLLVVEAPDPRTPALVRARLLENLGRAPVPNLADMLVRHGFAEPFRDAREVRSQIGPVSMSALARLEVTLRTDRESSPSLIVAADFRGAPLGVAARFDTEGARERSLEEISGRVIPIFGKWLSVGEAKRAPFGVQPARRWSVAARSLGADLEAEPTRADGGLRGEEAIAERLRLITRLKQHMRSEERQAADLDEPLAVGCVSDGRNRLEIELLGGRVGIVDISTLRDHLAQGPRVMVRAEVEVPRVDEQVATMSFRFGAEQEVPAWAAIARIESRIARFNEGQPPLVLPSAELDLLERLASAHAERCIDLELLSKLEAALESDAAGPVDFHLCLSTGRCDAGDDAFAVWMRSDRDHPRVRIHFDVPEFAGVQNYDELLRPIGLDAGLLLRLRTGPVLELLAAVLGHDAADVELVGPIVAA